MERAKPGEFRWNKRNCPPTYWPFQEPSPGRILRDPTIGEPGWCGHHQISLWEMMRIVLMQVRKTPKFAILRSILSDRTNLWVQEPLVTDRNTYTIQCKEFPWYDRKTPKIRRKSATRWRACRYSQTTHDDLEYHHQKYPDGDIVIKYTWTRETPKYLTEFGELPLHKETLHKETQRQQAVKRWLD